MPVLSVSKYFWKSQNLGQEDSDGNSKLVEGSECAPDIRRGYLGQVERCQSRVQTYVDTKYGMFKQIMKRPSQEQTLNKLFFFLNKKKDISQLPMTKMLVFVVALHGKSHHCLVNK